MWHLFNRHKGNKVVPSSGWVNRVASILNNVTAGTGIAMKCPTEPTTAAPWEIGVDVEWLRAFVGGAAITPNSLVASDGNGSLTALLALLTTAPTKDKQLQVTKGGTSVSWEDVGPADPSSAVVDLSVLGEGSAAAETNTWTFGGTNGVKVTLQTRTYYDHTATSPVLYAYYRTFTFDRNGRLYSISAETRYVVDTPVVGNLTS